MGYLHIDNLYKDQTILLFKRCYALEKIHGTSAHVSWSEGKVGFFSGGEAYEKFKALFDEPALAAAFTERIGEVSAVFYGEAYGGKQQGMSHTYGKETKFIVFDVAINDKWLDVPEAEALAKACGFEFVHYIEVSTDIDVLDSCRDQPSVQAIRNGIIDEPKMREGVVLRPLHEFVGNNGRRVIAKHKRPEFSERVTQPAVDVEKQKILDDAQAVATEWVTPMRLIHVLDKLGNPTDLSATGKVISAMVEDVMREASGEIADTKDIRKAIGVAAAKRFKARVCAIPPTA